MKTHHYIFTTTILFVILFYNENIGLNLALLGIAYALLTLYKTPKKNKKSIFYILFSLSITSCFAFAWFGDFSSSLALGMSLLLLDIKSNNTRAHTLLLIPAFIFSSITFPVRFFNFNQWAPKRGTAGILKKCIAFVIIPSFFVIIFYFIYSTGSTHFARFFVDYELDLNLWQLIFLTFIGFFIAFNFWNYKVEYCFYANNNLLNNTFKPNIEQKPTFSFLDIDSERMSGVISFIVLNLLLLFFIVTFNYEQFYEIEQNVDKLSDETHQRVGAVIGSIVMAIIVIMFYFKSSFNFDKKAKSLKTLAKVWIILNALLIFSALAKNTEYIINLGYTYKRLGVYAFLTLALTGLIFTLIKVNKQKTNAFLFNKMFWGLYCTILVCSYFNWGAFITEQNLKRKDFSWVYHNVDIDFNEKQLIKKAKQDGDTEKEKDIINELKEKKKQTLLSKTLYYESISTQ